MKRFIEILVLVSFFSYLTGDIFYSRVIEKNWNIKQGQYPEKAEITFRGNYAELREFLPKKTNELLENAYSIMGISKLSEYNDITVGDWEKAYFFSTLAADSGSDEAKVLLGILYSMETEYQDFKKSLKFFKQGPENNNSVARLILSNIEKYQIWPTVKYWDLRALNALDNKRRPKSF